jgi:fused signal recognition particle receptor
MPEGIVPELLIVAVFVVLIAIAWIGVRRRPGAPPEIPERPPEEPMGTTVEAEVAPEVEPLAEAPSLRTRLARSRTFLTDRLAQSLGRAPDDETWEDIEATLIQADVGVGFATELADELRAAAREKRATTPDEVRSLLSERLVAGFDGERDRALLFSPDGPTVWLVVGVNGTGKTTTIGKLARDLFLRERSVAVAAADTFRAAADEQLGIWAQRSGAQIVKHQPGADPGAVAFDAYQFARARKIDVLIVDTAGRLHTKTPLMDELAKVRRVLEKEGAVQESLLVIDATAGQNGLVQAREFASATGVTGIVLTKLDGTAKGGIALAIERELGIPIKLIGVGEGIDDLEPFEPKAFVDALLS